MRRCTELDSGVSAVSVGSGWAKFVADQRLLPGALLTFEVADSRCLVAALHGCSATVDHQTLQLERAVEANSANDRKTLVHPPVVPGDHVNPSEGVVTEAENESRPQFQKTLRKTHLKSNDAGRLVSS